MTDGDKMALLVIGVALISFWFGHIHGCSWCWENKIFSLEDLRKQAEAHKKKAKDRWRKK